MTQRKRYSEALKKVALDCENKQIVLQAMSEIVLEDKNYIENTIVKIATHTNGCNWIALPSIRVGSNA